MGKSKERDHERFRVGDSVRWTSHGVYTSTKEGVVVAVVPAYGSFWNFRKLLKGYDTSTLGKGSPRSHESYLVAVEQGPGEKPKIYFPWVGNLKRVQ